MTETEVATGCMIRASDLRVSDICSISDFGADPQAGPVVTAQAINSALKHVAQVESRTVIVSAGRYVVYTVRLCNRANMSMSEGAVLSVVSICDIQEGGFTQEGPGGNYLELEINTYVDVQDYAYFYLRNCLIWGNRIHNVVLSVLGLLDGSWVDSQGKRHGALAYFDPQNPDSRFKSGYREEWFGNEEIALFQCACVVLAGVQFLIGGRFAIFVTDTSDLPCGFLLIDINRDGIDLDSVRGVTVRRCQVNSLHDIGIVVKASMGAQRFAPASNVLIEVCEVSGYDVESVMAVSPSVDRVTCRLGINPIGRAKLGMEATCGYESVAIRQVRFRHCFGPAIAACDGSNVCQVLIEDIDMKEVTCPPFIRKGDRARYSVAGLDGNGVVGVEVCVRLNQLGCVVPDIRGLDPHLIRRFVPSYRTSEVNLSDGNRVELVDEQHPTQANLANWMKGPDGVDYLIRYDSAQTTYGLDTGKNLTPTDKERMGDAAGAACCARTVDVRLRGLVAKDLDPRYSVNLAGCLDARLQDIRLKDIHLELRGELSLEAAVEQRHITAQRLCTGSVWPMGGQPIQWMTKRHNKADEAFPPQVRWNQQAGEWLDVSFNVPEDATKYFEPVQFGIFSALSLYARCMDDFCLFGLTVAYQVPDSRPTMVSDDVRNGFLKGIDAGRNVRLICVSDAWKGPAGFEHAGKEPYVKTMVEDLDISPDLVVKDVSMVSPEPGIPSDDFYPYLNRADAAPVHIGKIRLTRPSRPPNTVHPPYFQTYPNYRIRPGERLDIEVHVRSPEIDADDDEGLIPAQNLPSEASSDGHVCIWTPAELVDGF